MFLLILYIYLSNFLVFSQNTTKDIIRSAKEEIGRHKHNLSVIRRNMSKNRMKKITSNSAPIKAKELIDFLIHNGLIDVRRNASVVIKVGNTSSIYLLRYILIDMSSFSHFFVSGQFTNEIISKPLFIYNLLSSLSIGICIRISESFSIEK